MLKFLKNRIQNQTQVNNDESASGTGTSQMLQMRKRIRMQAGLALLTIVLTLVLIFAMTAAWYTNVVQTSGLIFEVEQWGVDVSATITSAYIQAAPGDEGVIDFQVTNTGADAVNVAVSVTKNAMDPVMQRRLYFYVDGQKTTNQELVQRVYLNSETGYDYLLFGGGNLTLSETFHNDVPLKWHWVYDVLGYYVRMEADGQGKLQIAEYLRPIEYSFEKATFDAVTGELLTVNGVLTAQDFLVQLSQNDGYAGTIDPAKITADGYYPVEVDATTGRGVYAYLLDFNEIQTEMDTDSALGAAAGTDTAKTYTANFTIYAENYPVEGIAVSTPEALASALTSGTYPLIQLTQDITLTEAVTLSAGSNTVLDLNGHTLTTSTSDPAITAPEGSSLAMTNGALTGSAGSGHGIAITGADVVLNDVDLSGYVMGVRVLDHLGTGQDSVVRMIGCKSNTSDCAVFIQGNGAVSEQSTKLMIENCEFYSTDVVICGNGSADRWGTDIQIIGSTITSAVEAKTVAIYHPQAESVLNIANSTVTGFTGIAIKGGALSISNSEIFGVGTEAREPSATASGVEVTGDAVYVETNYNYRIHIIMDNQTNLTSYFNYGLRIYEENSPYVTVISEATENNKTQAGQ